MTVITVTLMMVVLSGQLCGELLLRGAPQGLSGRGEAGQAQQLVTFSWGGRLRQHQVKRVWDSGCELGISTLCSFSWRISPVSGNVANTPASSPPPPPACLTDEDKMP